MEKTAENALRAVNGLVGTFYHTLDSKKRLTIPGEWRDVMGEGPYVYVFPDMRDDCLMMVPMHEMETILAKMKEAALFDPEADARRQAFAENAQMIRVDGGGRIRVNDDLLGFADIRTKVTLIGAVRSAKIWAQEKKPPRAVAQKLDVTAFRSAMAGWGV